MNTRPSRAQIKNIYLDFFDFCRFKFGYFVEFLNNFQGLEALLIAQKALVDQYIERIVNKVSLFFSN